MPPAIRTAREAQEGSMISTLMLAFTSDPLARWIWPDPRDYLATAPDFIRAFGGAAIGLGTAFCTEDQRGAALWLAPGVRPDEEALVTIIQRTVRQSVQADLFALLEAMSAHHPSEPHWYLPIMIVC